MLQRREKIYLGIGITIALVALVFSGIGYAMAQDAPEDVSQRKEVLEQRIQEIESEIAELDQELYGVRQQANTLQGEVNRLDSTIHRSELAIEGLNLTMEQTQRQIAGREIAIQKTEEEMAQEQRTLAELLRTFQKQGDKTLVEMLLAKNLSEFFREVDALEVLQDEAQITLSQLHTLKEGLKHEQEVLGQKYEEVSTLRAVELAEKRNVEQKKQERAELLAQTRGEEAQYQQLIAKKQRDIAAIRQQINSLTRAGISVESAVQAAEIAAKGTGIRTAFLLALLETETGRRFANGQITAGSFTGTGNWQTDMKPNNRVTGLGQRKCFLEVTSRLGLNPDTVKVSAKPAYGWGGAMGVAQFLPCTWEHYQERVSQVTGNRPADPWNLIDGFTAAALYLANFGAAQQTYAAEVAAACAYISGRTTCPSSVAFYPSTIMDIAARIEQSL